MRNSEFVVFSCFVAVAFAGYVAAQQNATVQSQKRRDWRASFPAPTERKPVCG